MGASHGIVCGLPQVANDAGRLCRGGLCVRQLLSHILVIYFIDSEARQHHTIAAVFKTLRRQELQLPRRPQPRRAGGLPAGVRGCRLPVRYRPQRGWRPRGGLHGRLAGTRGLLTDARVCEASCLQNWRRVRSPTPRRWCATACRQPVVSTVGIVNTMLSARAEMSPWWHCSCQVLGSKDADSGASPSGVSAAAVGPRDRPGRYGTSGLSTVRICTMPADGRWHRQQLASSPDVAIWCSSKAKSSTANDAHISTRDQSTRVTDDLLLRALALSAVRA